MIEFSIKSSLKGSKTVPTIWVLLGPLLSALIGGVFSLLFALTGLIIVIAIFAVIMALNFIIEAVRNSRNTTGSPSAAARSESIPEDRIDMLTGLANENGLNAWFAEKTSRIIEDNKAIMVISADLANYAQLVASRGQEQADAILKEAARRVSTFTGEDGIAARTGTDEFAVIATVLPTQSLELVSDMAGKLTEMLQRPIEMPTGVVWIGGSVGAAMGKASESKDTLARARAALLKSKQQGVGHFFVDGLSH